MREPTGFLSKTVRSCKSIQDPLESFRILQGAHDDHGRDREGDDDDHDGDDDDENDDEDDDGDGYDGDDHDDHDDDDDDDDDDNDSSSSVLFWLTLC